jgi:Fic family protein
LIRDIHRLTTDGIDYPHNTPGVYRSNQPVAGDYLPPETNEEVRLLMGEFVSWLNSGERLHWDPIVRAIVSHFYVVSIHPFGDGNGRISRALESFLLYQGGINVRGFYSLANFYYENRSDYYNNLDSARFREGGDLTPFVLFALRGLESELKSIADGVVEETKWIAFKVFVHEIVLDSDKRQTPAVAMRLFKLATRIPSDGVTATQLNRIASSIAPEYRKLGERTLSRDVNKLIELDLWTNEDKILRPNIGRMDPFTASALPASE